jgi:hypothetical protein
MDSDAIELLQAQLDAHAEELRDRLDRVAEARARAGAAVQRARRAMEVLIAIEGSRVCRQAGYSPPAAGTCPTPGARGVNAETARLSDAV